MSIRFSIAAVDCGSPSYVVSNGSPGNPSNITFGGTVTYNCNHGYFLSGSAEVSCLANGSWSLPPICRGQYYSTPLGQCIYSHRHVLAIASCIIGHALLKHLPISMDIDC